MIVFCDINALYKLIGSIVGLLVGFVTFTQGKPVVGAWTFTFMALTVPLCLAILVVGHCLWQGSERARVRFVGIMVALFGLLALPCAFGGFDLGSVISMALYLAAIGILQSRSVRQYCGGEPPSSSAPGKGLKPSVCIAAIVVTAIAVGVVGRRLSRPQLAPRGPRPRPKESMRAPLAAQDAGVPVPSRSRTQRPGRGGLTLTEGVISLSRPPADWQFVPAALVVSPDSRHVAYAVKKGREWRMVLDGKTGPAYEGLGSPTFSPNSVRFAYIAARNGKHIAVVDGEERPGYGGICAFGFVFSPNAAHLAYGVRKGGRWRVIVDGKEGPGYDGIMSKPAFSPDSRRLAYAAKKQRRWLMVVDGVEGQDYDGIAEGEPTFSPNSKRLAYEVGKGGKWFVVVDNKEYPSHDATAALVFSPDSTRFAYAAKKGRNTIVVVDGEEGPPYDGAGIVDLTFSPDSARLAYGMTKGRNATVVVDGKEGPGYDVIGYGSLTFSPDSTHLAYLAERAKKWLLVMDGRESPAYDSIGALTFSPDSTRSAYWAERHGKYFVIVDGKQGRACGGIGALAFSPDSAHVAYVAKKGTKWLVVVDGKEGRSRFAGVAKGAELEFDSPSHFHIMALRSSPLEFVRVEVDIADSRSADEASSIDKP